MSGTVIEGREYVYLEVGVYEATKERFGHVRKTRIESEKSHKVNCCSGASTNTPHGVSVTDPQPLHLWLWKVNLCMCTFLYQLQVYLSVVLFAFICVFLVPCKHIHVLGVVPHLLVVEMQTTLYGHFIRYRASSAFYPLLPSKLL